MNDTDFMRRAMEIAEKGRGRTSPNPAVGAVIVRDGVIVGEGYTQPCGSDHAEIRALKAAGDLAQGADLYVTLEPCCHWGRTPPCTEAILAAGIKRVFAAIRDPNPLVCGRGLDILANHGIGTSYGLLGDLVEIQIEHFLHYMRFGKPFVTLKTATSLDGRIAAPDGASRWITGEASRQKVHRLRDTHDAVLTGIGTVLADDPQLDVRLPGEVKHPVRVILDTRARLPIESRIAQTSSTRPTLMFYSTDTADNRHLLKLKAMGIETIPAGCTQHGIDLDAVFSELGRRNIISVLVEAGATLVSSLLREDRVDRIVAFLAPMLLGGDHPVTTDVGVISLESARKWRFVSMESCGDDIVAELLPAIKQPEILPGNETE